MHLTPLEHNAFKRSYEITLIGNETYYQRENVEDFIINFPSRTSFPLVSEPVKFTSSSDAFWQNPEKSTAITSQLKFNYILHHILLDEANKSSGKIALYLQPDNDFLFSLLPNLNSSKTSLRIEHTFCLSKSAQMTADHKLYNLLYLKKILPLYINDLNYHPYYFYDDIHSHYYNFNGFPYMILTSEYAILCTSDYETGFLFHDSNIVSMLWTLYYSYQNHCSPLFHVVHSVFEQCTALGNMGWENVSGYSIQPEPCLVPYITQDIIRNNVYSHISEHASLFDFLWKYIVTAQKWVFNRKMHFYHTKEGLLDFAANGRISEIPIDIYKPASISERIELLQQFLTHCSSGCFHLLKSPLEHLSGNLHLCVNETSGYLLFTTVKNQNIYLIIEEPDILFKFLIMQKASTKTISTVRKKQWNLSRALLTI